MGPDAGCSSDEFAPLEDLDNVYITSNNVTDLFVSAERQQLSPNSTEFDPFAMDTAIVNMCQAINGNGGFIVKGWFKPSSTDDGATNEVKRIHVCLLKNYNDLTDAIAQMKY